MNNKPDGTASYKGVLLMLVSSVLACFGQLCWKLSAERISWLLVLGMALYAAGALIMLYAYRFGKLSVLQPILSFNYVFSAILGVVILGESFNLQMGIGVGIITCGVVILAGANKA